MGKMTLKEVTHQFVAEELERWKGESKNSRKRALLATERRRREIAKFKAWEEVVRVYRRRLTNKVLVGNEKVLLRVQRGEADVIASTLLDFLEAEVDFTKQNIECVERLFQAIGSLVRWCGVAASHEQGKESSQAIQAVLKTTHLIAERKRDSLVEQLEELQRKFNQRPDPQQQRLFEMATRRCFEKRKAIRAKRGYTFVAALEDENMINHHYDDGAFADNYDTLLNNYKKWRSRNRELVQKMERGDTVVT